MKGLNLFRTVRDWLRPRAPASRRRRSAPARRATRFYHPSFDPLEDRRLLSASAPSNEPPAAFSTIVGRSIFYNNSRFDGNNPAADSNDDGAIAIDKRALLPGQTATLANYTSYRGGINGVMVDFAGLVGMPTAADFLFHVGNSNDPRSWTKAPAPTSVTVRPGAGVSGSTRVTIIWSDSAIVNQWLQVGVRDTPTTGLAMPEVFYFGNAIGESGDSSARAVVDVTDQLASRSNPRGLANPVTVLSKSDYNRDGLVSAADEIISRRFASGFKNSLRLITPDSSFAWSDVVSRMVFYNNSQLDNSDAGANVADDNAIATEKVALLPGGMATFSNYTSFSRGLNGLMIDVAGLTQTLAPDDFDFRVGNDNNPAQWTQAPQPASISVRYGAGQQGSARVTIIWPDNAIQKQWLEVTVKATARTQLPAPDVFYFGNAVGETGDSTANAYVNLADVMLVRQAGSAGSFADETPFDINRDRLIDRADEYIVGANMATATTSLKLINLAPDPLRAQKSATGEMAFADFVSADVVARHIFYSNSQFDGYLPGANAQDDRAIAADKSALLPGATASFANYTNYSRGINGIIVDVAGLPGLPTADDFLFRVGNSADPSQWSAAPQPQSISVRPGAGVGGSARITIIWADNSIQRQWLQVTVKASANTGLKTADVFYFGNAIGESGNSTADARVDMTDQLAVRNRAYTIANPAPITATNDYNRDSLADWADEWLVARYASLDSLRLIAAPPTAPLSKPQREQVELFNRGDAGYNVFFAPTLVKTNSGTVLAIGEGRSAEDDFKSYALALRRSDNGGQTWSSISTVYSIPPNTGEYIGNPSAVVDATTGQIFLLFVRNTSRAFVTSSSDDGLTWSSPVEITTSVKVTSEGNPNPSAFPSDPWGWFVVGPGHGIQIQQGPFAGRLLIAGDHRLTADRSGPSWSHVIYSDDHGQTWHLGGGLDPTNPANDFSNEATVVEQSDGGLYMSIRINDGSPIRGFSRSYDGGMTWTTLRRDSRLTTYPVEASLLRVNENTVLLSAPDSTDGTRRQMTIWISRDNMVTWTKTKTVFFGYSGYSDMVLVGPDTVLLAYGRGHANGNSAQSIGLARFNLRWLESADPYQFTWNFNEQLPGERANIEGTSIQDYGLWDNRAQAQADSVAEAPVYVERAGGNTALSLTEGSDSVLLTPRATNALQFGSQDSFTVEIAMRTLDSSGVIIGTRPNVKGWTLQIVEGRPQFVLQDQQRTISITSAIAIDDGTWHRIALVRETTKYQLSKYNMYIDGAMGAMLLTDTTTSLLGSNEVVRIGAFNDGSGQLAFDVDTLRVTRAALTPERFLAANFLEPPRFPTPVSRSGSPDTLANLQFWLPSYDVTRNFADLGFADPLPIAPAIGTAVHTAIDASEKHYQVTTLSEWRKVLYAADSTVGASWLHAASTSAAGQAWTIRDSNGTGPNNFDFVQNTGVFTLSTFVKAGSSFGSLAALFDTTESSSVNSGFSLLLAPNGSLTMLISGPGTTLRLNQQSPSGLITPGEWYHVAVVGTGPGNPVTFYVTPVTATTVVPYRWGQAITGANGNFPTDANHNLTIGSFTKSGHASFNGQMVDQAIYDRGLSAADIQQLFNYTKRA